MKRKPTADATAPTVAPARNWLPALPLIILVLVAFQPIWQGGFLWEDDIYVTQNRLLTAPDGLWRIWFSQDSPSQYFPLVYSVFRLEHALWGFAPAGYHWVNLLLHAGSAVLVWRILKRLHVPGAWLGAALFALHPVQVESVAWVSELKNVLSLFFALLAVLTWIGFVEESSKRQWRWYALALLFQALALLAKTTACTLPVALLLVLWLTRKPMTRQRLVQVVPFAVLSLAMALLTMWWERHHIGTSGEAFALGPLARVLIASHGIWFYLGKLVWPVGLSFSYPRWAIDPIPPSAYLWFLLTLLAALALLWARRRAGRGPEAAALYFVATLSPMLGFVMLFTFWFSFVADHYQYAACIGPLALAAAALTAVLGRWRSPPWLGRAICGALVLGLAALTWHRATAFTSLEALWADAVRKNPASLLARRNLGNALRQNGKLDEAIDQFQQALQVNPKDVNSLIGLGNSLVASKRDDEAMETFRKALELSPNSPEANVNLAVVLANHQRLDEAIEHNRAAIQANPTHFTARVNLAACLASQQRYDEALEQYRIALKYDPDNILTHVNMAIALKGMGRTTEAQDHFRIASAKLTELADGLVQQKRLAAAVQRYREALRFDPQNSEAQRKLRELDPALSSKP